VVALTAAEGPVDGDNVDQVSHPLIVPPAGPGSRGGA
jgi:hypothetical protein